MAPPVEDTPCLADALGWLDRTLAFFATDGVVPLAILVSATVAMLVAIFGWWQNRKLNREQAALSLLLNQQQEFRRDSLAVWQMIQQDIDFGKLAESTPLGATGQVGGSCPEWNLPLDQRQFIVVNRLLKYYEAIATAVQRKIVDKKTIQRFMGPNIVYYVEKLYPFIIGTRTDGEIGDSKVWEDVETLAIKWGAKLPKK